MRMLLFHSSIFYLGHRIHTVSAHRYVRDAQHTDFGESMTFITACERAQDKLITISVRTVQLYVNHLVIIIW